MRFSLSFSIGFHKLEEEKEKNVNLIDELSFFEKLNKTPNLFETFGNELFKKLSNPV